MKVQHVSADKQMSVGLNWIGDTVGIVHLHSPMTKQVAHWHGQLLLFPSPHHHTCQESQQESKLGISQEPNTVQMCLWCISDCHLQHKPETKTLNSLSAVAFVCVTLSLLTTGCSFF